MHLRPLRGGSVGVGDKFNQEDGVRHNLTYKVFALSNSESSINSVNSENQIFIPYTPVLLVLLQCMLLWINKLSYYQGELSIKFNNTSVAS